MPPELTAQREAETLEDCQEAIGYCFRSLELLKGRWPLEGSFLESGVVSMAMIVSLSINFLDRPLISLCRFNKHIVKIAAIITHIILFQEAVDEDVGRSILRDDIHPSLYIPVKNSDR